MFKTLLVRFAEYLRMRETASGLSDTELISAHADLMPELGVELQKIRVIDEAMRRAREEPAQPGETKAPELPCALGRYQVRGYVGRGGFADVYVGHDEKLDCAVAIKVLRPDQRQDARNTIEQVMIEARFHARLRHPGILRVHDVGEQDEFCYIVSDLIDGPSLRDWLADDRPTWQQAVQIAVDVADTLQFVT